jgi:hypothetical protein
VGGVAVRGHDGYPAVTDGNPVRIAYHGDVFFDAA